GGETAEMPGFYGVDEYDLAGFAVGIVDEEDIIDGRQVRNGDLIIGISSSGIHSNGYSLVRRVFNMKKEALDVYYESLGASLGETLINPTKIYVNAIKAVKNANVNIKACGHITGGGFYENVPRMLPDGMHAKVQKDSYEIPPIFKMLSKDGAIKEEAMYNTFNMGIGMMLVVDSSDADKTLEAIRNAGETAYVIGEVIAGEKGVTLC
ncbi:MAG: phosphoribosylformylglycinamidine cyclo-ligase, partial [Clostridiales bacterium]|nr:phosphoribosylformylglycinamidine cyclo-ligase [Clostridiales bacterium]